MWKYLGFVEWNQNICLGWHATEWQHVNKKTEHVKRAKEKNLSTKQKWEKEYLTLEKHKEISGVKSNKKNMPVTISVVKNNSDSGENTIFDWKVN